MENTRKDETLLISQIAKRAVVLSKGNRRITQKTVFMNVSNWHEKFPLDLEKLMNFDDSDFMDDIVGIANHTDKKTKEIDALHFIPGSAWL